jgi:hypothetical protein
MRRLRALVLLSLCGALAACGNSVAPNDGGSDRPVVTDRVVPPGDVPLDEMIVPPDEGIDAPPEDGGGEPDALPPEDAFDAGEPDVFVEDVPVPTDAPPIDVPPADAGPMCPNGIAESCPAGGTSPCPDLNDGRAHTITFTGLRADLPASCEGAMTSLGPDGIVPLTLTAASDVTITGMPTGGDAVVLTLFTATGCGMAAGELRCSNSSATGGTARITATSLPPGQYYVAVSAARGNPALVQATVTPARPRMPGDVCPGVTVTPDGAPATITTTGFSGTADIGTSCGPTAGSAGWVDVVFTYTLTAPRDVTINVSATGTGAITVDLAATCGARNAALPGCTAANPVRRVVRAQAPGTYYVTVAYNGAPGRSIIATVTTSAPTMPPAGDRCPAIPLTAGMVSTVDASMLSPDFALLCVATSRADAIFSFANPAAGNDVLVNVTTTAAGATTALQLESTCGGAAVGPCVAAARNSIWQRYHGLTPGATSYLVGATTANTGMLSARYQVLPAATPTAVTTNDRCGGAFDIDPMRGGIYTGSTAMFNDDTTLPRPCIPARCGGGVDAIYRLDLRTATAPRRVLLNTIGSAFDTVLFVTTGMTCPGANVPNACNDDYYGQAAALDITLNPGLYWVVVSGCGFGARGNYQLDVIFP